MVCSHAWVSGGAIAAMGLSRIDASVGQGVPTTLKGWLSQAVVRSVFGRQLKVMCANMDCDPDRDHDTVCCKRRIADQA